MMILAFMNFRGVVIIVTVVRISLPLWLDVTETAAGMGGILIW